MTWCRSEYRRLEFERIAGLWAMILLYRFCFLVSVPLIQSYFWKLAQRRDRVLSTAASMTHSSFNVKLLANLKLYSNPLCEFQKCSKDEILEDYSGSFSISQEIIIFWNLGTWISDRFRAHSELVLNSRFEMWTHLCTKTKWSCEFPNCDIKRIQRRNDRMHGRTNVSAILDESLVFSTHLEYMSGFYQFSTTRALKSFNPPNTRIEAARSVHHRLMMISVPLRTALAGSEVFMWR